MKNPVRDLPRTIHLSMATTVLLYLLINVSYFVVLPATTVASSNTVVLDYGVKLFGTIGATVFSVVVAISCFGSLNAGFYTSECRPTRGWSGLICRISFSPHLRRGQGAPPAYFLCPSGISPTDSRPGNPVPSRHDQLLHRLWRRLPPTGQLF